MISKVILSALPLVALSSTLTAASTWTRIGPDSKPGEAATYWVSPHPKKADELLMAVRPGGVLHSTDGGKSWQSVTEPFDAEGNVGPNQESLARAPSNPDILYLGIETLGARRSNDGGRTWRKLATLPNGRAKNGVSVAVHPTNPDIAWLGTDGGIFKTTDGGKSWQRLTQGLPTGTTKGTKDISQTIGKIFVDQDNPDKLYFGMYATGLNEPAGIWSSQDAGASWMASSQGIDSGVIQVGPMPVQKDWVLAFARSASDPRVFVLITPNALYRSADGAKTWNKLAHEGGPTAIAIHPSDPQHLFLGEKDGSVSHSTDGGQTWKPLGSGLPVGTDANGKMIEFDFVAPDGTKTKVKGMNSRYQNHIATFAFDPLQPQMIYAAAKAGVYVLHLDMAKP
jgi:photosystem II stability/assembly factor-like uncharacterized protein